MVAGPPPQRHQQHAKRRRPSPERQVAGNALAAASLLPRGQQPCPPTVVHLTSLMVSMSCSLPQTGFGPELHAEMVPSAIALPVAYAFPGCAITSTRMVWVLSVHPTCADPNPLA